MKKIFKRLSAVLAVAALVLCVGVFAAPMTQKIDTRAEAALSDEESDTLYHFGNNYFSLLNSVTVFSKNVPYQFSFYASNQNGRFGDFLAVRLITMGQSSASSASVSTIVWDVALSSSYNYDSLPVGWAFQFVQGGFPYTSPVTLTNAVVPLLSTANAGSYDLSFQMNYFSAGKTAYIRCSRVSSVSIFPVTFSFSTVSVGSSPVRSYNGPTMPPSPIALQNFYWGSLVVGYTESQYEAYGNAQYTAGRTEGYNAGLADGINSVSGSDLAQGVKGFVFSLFDAPVNTFMSVFNFSYDGFNIGSLAALVLTAAVVIGVVKILL